MEKQCEKCGKLFSKNYNDSQKTWKIKKYCSKKCANSTKRKNVENMRKRMLGNKYTLGKKLSKEHKEKISASLKGKKKNNPSGEKAYNWKGGLSFLPYSVDWTETLKIAIRERDRYTCKLCGEKQGEKTFHVHHIDYNKKNCNPNNLITLCPNCHLRTNGNRNYWIEVFKQVPYEY